MAVSIFSAAKHLARYADWSLSNLQIQKLIYLSHMFYMGRNNGERLVNGNFEAWDYGPVNPSLYHRLKIYGADEVGQDMLINEEDIKGKQAQILEELYDVLGNERPSKLIAITHREGGAWERAYLSGNNIIISNADIMQEYKEITGK